MRNFILFLVALSAAIIFSSCKKDAISVDNSTLTIETYDNGLSVLNYYDNNFKVLAQLPTNFGDSVELHITSEADPTGFNVKVKTTEGSYEEGKQEYLYLGIDECFYASSFTDPDQRFIKVKANDDNIDVSIVGESVSSYIFIESGDVISIEYDLESSEELIPAKIILSGHQFTGEETFDIEVWTDKDDTHQVFSLVYDDPVNTRFAFSSFSTNLSFNKNGETIDQTLGVDENQQIYIMYNGKVFISAFEINTEKRLPQQG